MPVLFAIAAGNRSLYAPVFDNSNTPEAVAEAVANISSIINQTETFSNSPKTGETEVAVVPKNVTEVASEVESSSPLPTVVTAISTPESSTTEATTRRKPVCHPEVRFLFLFCFLICSIFL